MPMNLKDEIVAGESYSLEFKRVPNEEREKYQKTVVVFANGKGGRILFGVAKDRTVVGIPNERIFAEMDGTVNSIPDAWGLAAYGRSCEIARVFGSRMYGWGVSTDLTCTTLKEEQT